jgi:DMSO/TMAO reductase YedYZ heme-binding membrane subunit
VIAVAVLVIAAGAAGTARGRDIVAAVQRFSLFYAGVFALLALTAAVVVGLAGTDRVVMTPGGRVVGQVVHRVLSLAALAALATHIVLEIVAHRSAAIDAFVPFLARGRTFYIGLGTIASDLIVLIVLTSVARGRFAARPVIWRAIHVTAYLAWLLGILHGLLAGRTAKPYVDWSYGACAAAVAAALAIRIIQR